MYIGKIKETSEGCKNHERHRKMKQSIPKEVNYNGRHGAIFKLNIIMITER